ncbi:MAG: hypothetical protein CME19_07555 [Gemmatimonadetes bacterium]|nr:hypothetical protein [Gemmatimonadota bacterium]|tara:strand:+ start:122 stop:376 length:255 start_codon:yes stop_codon:yes gene_type:complete
MGHGVGREIHEAPNIPNYEAPWMHERFTEGLVVTVDPIITAGTNDFYEMDDGWTNRTVDGSLAAHHAHTTVITNSKPLILTETA